MQGTQVRALVWEDPTCRGAKKPVCHNYWACALECTSHNYWARHATTTEACVPRAHTPQQRKPPQWEACAPQWRPNAAKNKINKFIFKKRSTFKIIFLITLYFILLSRICHFLLDLDFDQDPCSFRVLRSSLMTVFEYLDFLTITVGRVLLFPVSAGFFMIHALHFIVNM